MPHLKKQILQMSREKAGTLPAAIARLKAKVEAITLLPVLLPEDTQSPPHVAVHLAAPLLLGQKTLTKTLTYGNINKWNETLNIH